MKTLFKIFAVIFLLNILNIIISIVCIIYELMRFFNTNNFFVDLLIFSIFMLFPLSLMLIGLLSEPLKSIKIWKWNLK